jgi:hypothetical protein
LNNPNSGKKKKTLSHYINPHASSPWDKIININTPTRSWKYI